MKRRPEARPEIRDTIDTSYTMADPRPPGPRELDRNPAAHHCLRMPDLRALAVLSPLLGCGADATPATAPLAGDWRAPSDLDGADEVLSLDEDGLGEATLYRLTSALTTKLEYDVTAEPRDDDGRFDLSFRCEGRSFMCETWDFETECSFEDGAQLICESPSWRENAGVIAFTRG